MLGCPCSWMWLRLILPTRPKKPTGLNAAGCIPRTSSGLKFQPETEFRLNGVSGKLIACGLNSIFEQFLPSLDGKITDNLKNETFQNRKYVSFKTFWCKGIGMIWRDAGLIWCDGGLGNRKIVF